jgi:hypothetical protein
MQPARFLCLTSCLLFPASANLQAQQPKPPQKLDSVNLERAHVMLKQVHDEIKKNYYDSTYHGVDLDTTFHQYDQRLDASRDVNDTFHVIAAYVMQLHDTHTFFIPPSRTNFSTMGYALEMVGDKCFITHIRPGTDAAKKLHVGEQVLAINGFGIRKAEFSNELYFFHTLTPAPAEMLEVQNPAGERRKETIQALLIPGKHILDLTDEGTGDFNKLIREDEDDDQLNRQRFYETGDVIVWKMPSFEVSPRDIDSAFGKVGKHTTLILDLRDNHGGYADILKQMLAHLIDHDVKIADRVARKDTKPIETKTRGSSAFQGKLIVLIDNQSASASELLARVVQLEKRGTVLGDRSEGAVMEARDYTEQIGTDYAVLYELSVTAANLLMTDGKSLENVGVTPDQTILPTAQELSDGKDPVLTQALQAAGVTLDPTAAGKLFPFEWPNL